MSRLRSAIVAEYANKLRCEMDSQERSGKPLDGRVGVIVVVPAYNEAQTVGHLIRALSRQTSKNFELIVVDSGSQDNTRSVVQRLREHVDYAVHVLSEAKPGAGNARKRGMDEAVLRFYERDPRTEGSCLIAGTDADAQPLPYWIETILDSAKNFESGSLTGTHIGSDEINALVATKKGLENYFNKASDFITFFAKNRIGKVTMRGPNSAIEIEAYCASGGMHQPVEGVKEASRLQERINHAGYKTIFFDAPVIVSQRRHLSELLNGGRHAQYTPCGTSSARFTSIRQLEEDLLRPALHLPVESWVSYQGKILEAVIANVVLRPVYMKQVAPNSLSAVLTESGVSSIVSDLDKGSPLDELITQYGQEIKRSTEEHLRTSKDL